MQAEALLGYSRGKNGSLQTLDSYLISNAQLTIISKFCEAKRDMRLFKYGLITLLCQSSY